MKVLFLIFILVVVTMLATPVGAQDDYAAQVTYLDEIRCEQLKPRTGFFGKIGRLLGGGSESDNISLPFDLVAVEDKLFATCQNIPALVEILPESKSFRLHNCDELPFLYPIALASSADGRVFVTDSERGAVYLFEDGKVQPFIVEGLVRPTGITICTGTGHLYIVDTGEHALKVFDQDGNLTHTVVGGDQPLLHYPTFAAATDDGKVYVNDALNYRIRCFDDEGRLIASFGAEGDAPGYFVRPKGIEADSLGNVYVVDNMQDLVQVFDSSGQLLAALGGSGTLPGQFWSPSGIEIANDTIYVADTFNDRIQLLRFRGSVK